MRPSWIIVSALCAGLTIGSPTRAQCPSGQWGPSYGPMTTFTGAVLDAVQPGALGDAAHLHIDLVLGSVSATASGYCPTEIGYYGDLGATFADEYRIIGPPSATPVAVTAVLHAEGRAEAYWFDMPTIGLVCRTSYASCSIQETAPGVSRNWPVQPCVTPAEIGEDLRLPLLHLPGEPFLLSFAVAARSGCSFTSFTTQLRFEGLPEGYSVTSCHGFTPPTPVATRRTNWATLKAHYR